jgi:hypothetical protein
MACWREIVIVEDYISKCLGFFSFLIYGQILWREKMQRSIVLLAVLVTALAGVQGCAGQCYAAPGPDSNEEYLFAQSVCGSVDNGPLNPTVFTIDETRTITKIGAYHWNNGNGATPGTIGLKDKNDKIWGPWQAEGLSGQGGVSNANWVVHLTPGWELPAGTYTVMDSDPSTWSYGSESGECGIVSVIALKPGSEPIDNHGAEYGGESGSNADSSRNPSAPGKIGFWILKEVQPDVLPQSDRSDGAYYNYHVSYKENSVTGGYSWKDSSCHGDVWATCSWTEFPKVLVPGDKQETTLTDETGGNQSCGYRNIGAGTWLRINGGKVGPDADYGYATSDPKPAPASAKDSWDVPQGKLGDTLTVSIAVSHPVAQSNHHYINYIYSYNAGGTNGGIGLTASQLAGSWKMAGHQTGFNDWEADLVLNDDGTLSWTETKGASVGAARTGTWKIDGITFSMKWSSPSGGQTEWISHSVARDNIEDGTYTVENAPGGTWSASRL